MSEIRYIASLSSHTSSPFWTSAIADQRGNPILNQLMCITEEFHPTKELYDCTFCEQNIYNGYSVFFNKYL